MDREADERRDADAESIAARGEMETPEFRTWAGADATMLAIAFTDIVGSTALGVKLGDERMHEVRMPHLRRLATRAESHGGRVVKTTGDGVMAAFHVAGKALDFVLEAHRDEGTDGLRVRAGIHVGPVRIEGGDIL